MRFIIATLFLASVTMAADMGMNIHGNAYNFGYNTGDAGGHSRAESGSSGSVAGSYSYIDANGDRRTVHYTAGPEGYKASGDISVDRRTAAAAAALNAMAPKAPLPVAAVPVAPAVHGAWYGGHYAHPAAIPANFFHGGYAARW